MLVWKESICAECVGVAVEGGVWYMRRGLLSWVF